MYWEYEIAQVSNKGIMLKNGTFIDFYACVENFSREYGKTNTNCVGERNITRLNFTFYTSPKPIVIMFQKKGKLVEFFSKVNTYQRFHNLQKEIIQYGYKTYDMS